jgi:hypothetical protein
VHVPTGLAAHATVVCISGTRSLLRLWVVSTGFDVSALSTAAAILSRPGSSGIRVRAQCNDDGTVFLPGFGYVNRLIFEAALSIPDPDSWCDQQTASHHAALTSELGERLAAVSEGQRFFKSPVSNSGNATASMA